MSAEPSFEEPTTPRVAGTDQLRAELAALPPDQREDYWYSRVYRSETRQLTIRAGIMGALLGGIMSVSNLYLGLKTGFSIGATFTAGILAFAIFKTLERILPGGEFTDLENNAMQSVASAAGFMASAGLVTAIPALALMNQPALNAWQVGAWLAMVSFLGVLVAVPLKRQMINIEQLPFPSGTAAAEMIKSLHGEGTSAMQRARALLGAAGVGAVLAYFRDGQAAFMGKLAGTWAGAKSLAVLSIPASLSPFPGVRGIAPGKLTVGLDISFVLPAAGAIIGLRTSLSLLAGAVFNWLVVAPWLIENHIEVNHKIITGGFGKIVGWSAWPASGIMLAAALTATAFQWRAFANTFSQLKKLASGQGGPVDDRSKATEVPVSWVLGGLLLTGIASVALQYFMFDIPPLLGALAVVMALILSLVVARATGETDIAPPVTKLSQVGNALLTAGHPVTNLMTAGVTTGATLHAADLLTDLKSGYLLGARPRQQFFAQIIGVLAGSVFAAPAYAILVPNAGVLGTKYAAPGAFSTKATSEAMANGFSAIPHTALNMMAFMLVLGVILTLLEAKLPQYRKWIPSAMGLGLGMITPFSSVVSIAVGGFVAWLWSLANPQQAERYTIPVASGLITGESLMAVFIQGIGYFFGIEV